MKLHQFQPGEACAVIMREQSKVERGARMYRYKLIRNAKVLKAQGASREHIEGCVKLARMFGRLERYATYMARSAVCAYYGYSYEHAYGRYSRQATV